jgi:phosphotransferase system enzyme I (PtsI)
MSVQSKPPAVSQVVLDGLPVSPGVGIGKAFLLYDVPVAPVSEPLEETARLEELARLEEAFQKTSDELASLHDKVRRQVGSEQAAVFLAHQTILNDPALREKIRREISEDRVSAQTALHKVLGQYESLLTRITDEYLRERVVDLRDVIRRLSRHLGRDHFGPHLLSGPLILVCHELLPSDVVALTEHDVVGIVTQTGGTTSHAAVLARGFGIPAVSGIADAPHRMATGDEVIVDGRAGHVFVKPDSETESAYRELRREFRLLKKSLATNREQRAVSADGISMELLANVNNLADVENATMMGAEGIGLFRTEFLFLTHPDIPDEDEQVAAYRQIIEASPGNTVTIRTLDLGGDKTVPYLERTRELNPFLGWRSIRLSFEHPKLFSRQIRAVLRSAADTTKDVRILFPMVTTLEEVRHLRRLVRRAARYLQSKGSACKEVPIGIMIEVPVAALSIETLLPHVNFVSIGSNDLVQYLTAADRDNPKVSHLCQPLNPAVLKVLSWVVDACDRAGKPVSICGEMAGSPCAFPLLFGMGLRSFSMSPSFVPSIKELLSHLTVADARRLMERALCQNSTNRVIRLTDVWLDALAPRLKLLETTGGT